MAALRTGITAAQRDAIRAFSEATERAMVQINKYHELLDRIENEVRAGGAQAEVERRHEDERTQLSYALADAETAMDDAHAALKRAMGRRMADVRPSGGKRKTRRGKSRRSTRY